MDSLKLGVAGTNALGMQDRVFREVVASISISIIVAFLSSRCRLPTLQPTVSPEGTTCPSVPMSRGCVPGLQVAMVQETFKHTHTESSSTPSECPFPPSLSQSMYTQLSTFPSSNADHYDVLRTSKH